MSYKYTGKKIAIMATDRCNTKCKHCHLDYHGHFECSNLTNFVIKNSKDHIIKLNGAEVILHKDYYPILQMCGQNFIKTNGLEIVKNPNILYDLKKYGINSITMSHHFSAHTSISEIPIYVIEQATKQIVNCKMELWYMTVINTDNYKEIPLMCEYAFRNGVSCIYFVNMLNTGRATKMPDKKILSEEQIRYVLLDIQKMRQKYDEVDLKISRSGTFEQTNNINSNFICPAGKNTIAITPDGKVKPCVGLTGEQYTIGHIENNEIIIDRKILHDGTKCIVHQIVNKGASINEFIS